MINIRDIDHLVLRVRDIDVMRRFYCEVLGAEHVIYRPEFGMSHLRIGDAMIDLVEREAPSGVNMDHLCLRVEPFNQDEIGFGETPTAGYTLLGATVSYTANSGSRDMSRPEFTIGLKGDNLLNDDVRNAVSFKKDEVLEPGASVVTGQTNPSQTTSRPQNQGGSILPVPGGARPGAPGGGGPVIIERRG